ncbi:MAG: D-tyrosyl-tRNA(Tyr) deacylase [Burkholderiaceae bacterium]|nr:D-tyrosyl-tRNA(Tyr) deacylase [Burkholderiaceae bacterium]
MIGLIQRVSSASVAVDARCVASIGRGLLVLLCAQRGDDTGQAAALLERILGYRVFADERGRMNRSLRDLASEPSGAGLLLVPQFTLAADTRSGTRPSFTPAAPPDLARELFDWMVVKARDSFQATGAGVFGADMAVSLVNDGPVTFWLEVSPESGRRERSANAGRT